MSDALYSIMSVGEWSAYTLTSCPMNFFLRVNSALIFNLMLLQTILLVPIVPHGVLQLGSLEKVSSQHK